MKLRIPVLLALMLGLQMTAFAHDAWIEPQGNDYAVLWGHSVAKSGAYNQDKVKALAAFDAHGKELKIVRESGKDSLQFKVKGKVSLLTLKFESGYYTKTTDGSKPLPKNEVPNAVSSSYSTKFGKTIASWSKAVSKPHGQQLEIVPLDSSAPHAGGKLQLQVLFNGQPLAGVKLNSGAEHADAKAMLPETDATGKASVGVAHGRNTISISHKVPTPGNPKMDNYGYSANLIFDVK